MQLFCIQYPINDSYSVIYRGCSTTLYNIYTFYDPHRLYASIILRYNVISSLILTIQLSAYQNRLQSSVVASIFWLSLATSTVILDSQPQRSPSLRGSLSWNRGCRSSTWTRSPEARAWSSSHAGLRLVSHGGLPLSGSSGLGLESGVLNIRVYYPY
jgi:hypothetical protein